MSVLNPFIEPGDHCLVPEDGAVITQSRMVTDRLKVKHILDDDGNFIKAELIPIKETKEIKKLSLLWTKNYQ